MPAEHYYVDGTLRQGYYCGTCGEQIGNMFGHWLLRDHDDTDTSCEPNPTLVEAMQKANPYDNKKPHFSRPATTTIVK